jgi:hypothetical protein
MKLFKRLNPSGEFIEALYSVKLEKFSDGTEEEVLQFLNHTNSWVRSRRVHTEGLIPITQQEFDALITKKGEGK